MGSLTRDFEIESYSEDTLDQFSTSPTFLRRCAALRCEFGAPFFAYCEGGKRYRVVQGCCNHWECARCGHMVASKHYGRIVEGAREIARTNEIWFITITCRGAELSEQEATRSYLAWTSKFLDACYTRAHRITKQHPIAEAWFYVQVTEKQKRGHPHSHILTSFHPADTVEGLVSDWVTDSTGNRVCEYREALRSQWLQSTVCNAGLGDQYDISKIQTIEGASRYVAKYMFKESQFQAHYPKGWKRVRYSQSWPDYEKPKTDAFVLLAREDWGRLAGAAAVVDADEGEAFESASYFLSEFDTLVYRRKNEQSSEPKNKKTHKDRRV